MSGHERISASIDFVVPCYNELEALPETHRQLSTLMETLRRADLASAQSRIYYVDDGSTDGTWELICGFARGPGVVGLRLSRNFGHQSALLAGLFSASGDAAITIDADLQDDIGVIPQMIGNFRGGSEIVYGVRRERTTDTAFKRGTAQLFYGLLQRFGVRTIPNHADYRLMSRRAIAALAQFTEVNVFLRGIVPLLGFKSSLVYYDRKTRLAGSSKYNLAKMVNLSLDGVSSFSTAPLRFVAIMGFLVFLLSFAMAGWVAWIKLFTLRAVPGWASSVIPIYFLGGIQILCLGVIGEYLGKSYAETKRRPRFLISETASSARSDGPPATDGPQTTGTPPTTATRPPIF